MPLSTFAQPALGFRLGMCGVWEARLDFGPGYRLYWNVELAEDLGSPTFAPKFLLAAIDEGVRFTPPSAEWSKPWG